MKQRKIIWLNATKQVPLAPQLKAAKPWCAGAWKLAAIYENGKPGQDIDALLSELVAGDPVGVYRADLLAYNPAKRSKQSTSEVFNDVANRLVQSGAVLHELSTGRVSSDVTEVVAMMLEARSRIAQNGVGRKSKGRPGKFENTTKEQFRAIYNAWKNSDHENDDQRIAAVHAAGFPDFKGGNWYSLAKAGAFDAFTEQEPNQT